MAELEVEGDELVLQLSALEKVEAETAQQVVLASLTGRRPAGAGE